MVEQIPPCRRYDGWVEYVLREQQIRRVRRQRLVIWLGVVLALACLAAAAKLKGGL